VAAQRKEITRNNPYDDLHYLSKLYREEALRGANERNDRASADALFGQIWDVLAPDPERDQLRCRRAPRQGFDGPGPLAGPTHVEEIGSR
jgi:hypothetical protein